MLTVTDLRVDNEPQPLGLDHQYPKFSWIPISEQRNQRQRAYQIMVADCEAALADSGKLFWDSGKVSSSATFAIAYEGKPLQGAHSYWWKVRIWGQDGGQSDWSAPARFGLGPQGEAGWTAAWIGRGPMAETKLEFGKASGSEAYEKIYGVIPVETEAAFLRREFSLAKPVKRATLFVSGLGFYYLHLNGRRVGRNVHTPSKTDYRAQVLYDAYDVTSMLENGSNALGLVLGNGWYNPLKKWWDWHMQWHGSKRAILQLHLEHEDGSGSVVATDGSWKTSLGPIREHCIYDGELYDARLEQAGWDMPGFDDSSWVKANEVDAPGGDLHFHDIEPVQVTETIRPKALWEASPGVWIFDLAQNFSGFVRLRVQGPRGQTIKIRHAENIHPGSGCLNPGTNGQAFNLDQYILKGDGIEIYEPHFCYHGFRYVEISGWPGAPSLDSIEGQVIHTASRQTGELRTANELINHIHRCTVWSQRSNMMGLPTDDNQRDERLGWMADGHLAAEQFMRNFECVRFYRKWLRDIKCSQDPELGSIPYIVPRPFFGHGSSTPAWSSAYPLVAWYLYEHTGDKSILAEHFEPICRYVDYLSSRASDCIPPKDNYGDHLSCADGWTRSEPALTSTFYYYYDAVLAVRMAEVLGRKAEAERYRELSARIRDAFNRAYLNTAKHVYGNRTHCEQIMPLWLEMAPENEHGAVLAGLLDNIVNENHNHLRVGILGAKYALDLLMAENRNDVIWDFATKEDFPSFGYMTKGYTTFSETWNRTGTNNHVMWGHIDTWFYAGLAGIRSAGDGYGNILIQPYMPESLPWAKAAVHTLRGRVASCWQRQDGQMIIDLSVPANTTAELRLPTQALRDQRIFEGGKLVWDGCFHAVSDGVLDGNGNDNWTSVEMGSGNYRFVCEWRDIPSASIAAMRNPWRMDFGGGWMLSRPVGGGQIGEAVCVKLADNLGWTPIKGAPFINIHERYSGNEGVVYLAKRILVKDAGEWIFNIGHDGGMRLFIDGAMVAEECKTINPAPQVRTSAAVKLAAGEHELVIAFNTDSGKGWGVFTSLEIPLCARQHGKKPVFPGSVR